MLVLLLYAIVNVAVVAVVSNAKAMVGTGTTSPTYAMSTILTTTTTHATANHAP